YAGDLELRRAEWVDASKASIQQGNFRVEIVEVRVGRVRDLPASNYLLITVRVYRSGLPSETVGPSLSWDEKATAVLRDSSESRYDQVAVIREGERGTGPVPRPGLQVADTLLAFTLPSGNNEPLQFVLPAAACGGVGEFKFAIPKAMIK